MQSFFITFDYGGTKTEAMLFDSHAQPISFADDRGLRKPNFPGKNRMCYYLRATLDRLLHPYQLTLNAIKRIIIACCGADWPADFSRIQHKVANCLNYPVERIMVVNDCLAALRGGLFPHESKSNCAVLCAGTHMNCMLRAANGATFTYGRFIAPRDQGSYALGQHVWAAIIDAYNGFSPPTMLTTLVLEYHHCDSLPQLCEKVTQDGNIFNPTHYAVIGLQAANLDDPVALQIVTEMAQRWAQYIIHGMNKVNIALEEDFVVVCAGRFFLDLGIVLVEALKKSLLATCTHTHIHLAHNRPVIGAAQFLLDDGLFEECCLRGESPR